MDNQVSLSQVFARNLRVMMAMLNIKASKLHEMTGISISTINNLSNGNRAKGIKFSTIDKLASAFNCAPGDLFELNANNLRSIYVSDWKEEIRALGEKED